MHFPTTGLAALAPVEQLFGTLLNAARVQFSDDTIVVLMVFLYELLPAKSFF